MGMPVPCGSRAYVVTVAMVDAEVVIKKPARRTANGFFKEKVMEKIVYPSNRYNPFVNLNRVLVSLNIPFHYITKNRFCKGDFCI